jgi:hypothetical protein
MFFSRELLEDKNLSLDERAEINAVLIPAVANGDQLTFAEAKYLGGVLEATFTDDYDTSALLEKIYSSLDIFKFWQIYMRYAKDLDGTGTIKSPRGPESVRQKQIDVAYLNAELSDWKPLIEKTNHKHTVMQFLSKQARDEYKESMEWSAKLQEDNARRQYVEKSVLLFSKFVFIKVEEYYQEYDVRKDITTFCGRETVVDGFTYTHILMRHFSPYAKFGRPGLTFHHDPEIDVANLPRSIFYFLSQYDRYVGATCFNEENIFFRFNGRNYVIWFKKLERKIKGGNLINYLRVQTFYPAELQNDVQAMCALNMIRISDRLSFYV